MKNLKISGACSVLWEHSENGGVTPINACRLRETAETFKETHAGNNLFITREPTVLLENQLYLPGKLVEPSKEDIEVYSRQFTALEYSSIVALLQAFAFKRPSVHELKMLSAVVAQLRI